MEKSFDYNLHTFDSGLRLVTVPMPSAKTATVMVLAGTGNNYETKEIAGISHFLEHMMFKGTTNRPDKRAISGQLDSIGAEYNAFTGREETGYHARASAAKVEVIMDVVYDIYLNSLLDVKEIEIERGVIAEELRMYRDNPMRHVAEIFDKVMYGDQPAGWGIEEELAALPNLKRDDFVSYFQTHYIAENTVIGVAGDIDPDLVIEKTGKYFSRIRQGQIVQKSPVIEKQKEPNISVYSKETDQTHFIIGLKAYNMFDEKRYILGVLANILGGGMSSRLWHEVREKRGLAYYISASQDNFLDHGYLYINAGVNNKRAVEAVKVVLDELGRVKAEGVTEKELRRVKDQAEGGLAIALESSQAVAQNYAASVLFHGRVLTPEEELDKIRKVTLDDVKAVAADIFDNVRLNLAVVGPFKDSESFRKILNF